MVGNPENRETFLLLAFTAWSYKSVSVKTACLVQFVHEPLQLPFPFLESTKDVAQCDILDGF